MVRHLGEFEAAGKVENAVPPVAKVLSVPGAHLHLYGKASLPGREVGHVTVCNPTGARELQSVPDVITDLAAGGKSDLKWTEHDDY